MKMKLMSVCLLGGMLGAAAAGQNTGSSSAKREPALPYIPSLDLTAMDKTADPCVNFYQYSCGGWKKDNPIPADQTSWSVYGKLYQDNLEFLRAILEQVSADRPGRTPVEQKIGDFYAACMDETAVEKQGLGPVRGQLDAVEKLSSAKEIAPVVAELQLVYGRAMLFVGS